MHVAFDASPGDDFQTFSANRAFHAAADHYGCGLDLAFQAAVGTDDDVRFRFDIAFDCAVDVQRIAQGEIADKLAARGDDG